MRLLEATVSQMELRAEPPRLDPPAGPEAFRLREIPNVPLELYRKLYDAVGAPHHWTSRHLDDAALAAVLHGKGASVHVLEADGEPAGWFELEADRRPGATRIVHFGIMPAFRGRHLSPYLLREAIHRAFATGAGTVTLETNTLDHPAAMPLYRDAGFVCVLRRVVATPAVAS